MTIKTNLRNVGEIAAAEKSFTGSNLFGNTYSEFRASTGRLPEDWAKDLRSTGARYVVFSYFTPILWVTPEGEVVCPDVKYSVSTSRQVSSVLRGFNYGQGVRRTLKSEVAA